MDPSQSQAMETFMSVTGSSRALALQRLQAHGWDLNAAINAFFNDGEDSRLQRQTDISGGDWMEEDEPPQLDPSRPPIIQNLSSWGNLDPELNQHSGMGGLSVRGTAPVISHPREVREVPIDWQDHDTLARPQSALVIEEVPSTEVDVLTPETQRQVIVDDNDNSPSTASSAFRGSLERNDRNLGNSADYGNIQPENRTNIPFLEDPGFRNDDGLDIEEEMLRVAIEASRKEAEEANRRPNYSNPVQAEDDDFAMAVSLSIQTAEQEKVLREVGNTGSPQGIMQDDYDGTNVSLGIRNIGCFQSPGSTIVDNTTKMVKDVLDTALPNGEVNVGTLRSSLNRVPNSSNEEHEEQPLLRRRSTRRSGTAATLRGSGSGLSRQELDSPQHESGRSPYIPENEYNSTSPPQTNARTLHNAEWGGISSEEHEEAVMLEAMFGTLPENAVARFGYPTIQSDSNALLPDIPQGYEHSFQPPSPTIIAKRLLREQQDHEYRASLEADREKEMKALLVAENRRMKEVNAAASAEAEEQQRFQEEQSRIHAEKELERILAAKKSALPSEPAMEDENAITLLVRMPDGSRHGRRFRKSEKLQCLFDFIDVGRVVKPGSYRLVRPYPRQAFTDAEHGLSFSDLGLNSKLEALFLELI